MYSRTVNRQGEAIAYSSQLPIKEIHLRRADKACDKQIFRSVINLPWRSNLHNVAIFHDHNAVSKRHGLGLVMGYIDKCRVNAMAQLNQLRTHLITQLCVQIAEGFIHQEHLWFADDGSPDSDALALSTRESLRLTLEVVGNAEDFGGIFDDLFGGRGRRAPPPKGANVAYRLAVSFIDAATQAPQRITLSDGKSIDLKLPAGVESGTQMRLAGKGEQGPGGFGDATVTIEVKPHAFFRRDGADIRLDLPITLKEAVLGAKVKVPTVDGAVMLTVPAGSSSGKVLRLKGKGFSRKDKTRGDQLVSLMIDLPKDDAALTAFAEGWDDERAVRAALGV